MQKNYIGLEVFNEKIQIAILSRQNSQWRINEILTILRSEEGLEKDLHLIRRRIKSIKQAILCLPEIPVLIKEFTLDPSLSAQEIYHYLQLQSAIILGQPFDHWFLDFEPCISHPLLSHLTNFRIAAIPRESTNRQLEICRSAGFKIKALDLEIFALSRLICHFEGYQPEMTQGLVLIKEKELLFLACLDGRLIYTKKTSYSLDYSVSQLLAPLIQFYNRVFPEFNLTQIYLLANQKILSIEGISIESPSLKSSIWQFSLSPEINELVSLGLAIYGY